MLRPDVEALLKRPRIEKPEEEFLLPGPLPEPGTASESLPPPQVAERLPVADQIVQEAAQLSLWLDLITRFAPPVTVPVPPEHQAALGATVSTAQYLASVADPAPDPPARAAQSVQQQLFETAVLTHPGGHDMWLPLVVRDLTEMRDELMTTVTGVEAAFQQANQAPSALPVSGADPHLDAVHQTLLEQSQLYRAHLFNTTLSFRQGLVETTAGKLLAPLLEAPLDRLRPVAQDLIRELTTVRAMLSHAQLLLSLEHFRLRDSLFGLLKEQLLEKLLQMAVGMLGRAQSTLVRPVLATLERLEPAAHSLAGSVENQAGEALGRMLSHTMLALEQQYLDLAADLVRSLQKKGGLRLQKLQTLGERTTVGQWVGHLDQMITELRHFLAQPAMARTAADSLVRAVTRRYPGHPARVLEGLPTLSGGPLPEPAPYPLRSQPYTGGDPNLTGRGPLA
jgi:hypothetical protein